MLKMSLRLVSALTVATMLLTSLVLEVSGEKQTKPQPKLTENEFLVNNIPSVSRILKAEGVEIEPELLFTLNGRKKLRPVLTAFTDMQMSKVASEPLRGVVMADNLTFPEQSQIAADTVIIAKHITFTGRAPTIKGPHDFHMFALDSVIIENAPETVITIDTSGLGRIGPRQRQTPVDTTRGAVFNSSGTGSNAWSEFHRAPETPEEIKSTAEFDGVDGTPGTAGKYGANGLAGKAGACSAQVDGLTGNPGTDGSKGSDRGAGTSGKNATNAGHQTIMFDNVDGDGGFMNLIARGGTGGNGGAGGRGGNGGRGGDGGAGGSGVGCSCDPRRIGRGGDGGMAGRGGAGGTGGPGGNGGNGGNAGSIVAAFPNNPKIRPLGTNSQGGSGGRGGMPGRGGDGGTAGTPGAPGKAGSVSGCAFGKHDGRNETGMPGPRGGSGTSGAGGNGGASGSLWWGIVGVNGL